MEYEELADLIHEYNATIINNRLEYDEYRGKSNDDLKNAYQDVADHLYDASDKMMDTTDGTSLDMEALLQTQPFHGFRQNRTRTRPLPPAQASV